ncbi:MAG: hypothetical protein NC548_32275 [Lachnospiraceae bacterium]|nr:hypothetical protein [Lachnospiraceae bacterium]
MIEAGQIRQLLTGEQDGTNLFCIGLGKVVQQTGELYVVELQFATSPISTKNQSIFCKKVGLLSYQIEPGDLVLVGQARTLDNVYVSQMSVKCGYIVDKVLPAKALSLDIVDELTLTSGGAEIAKITPQRVTFNVPVEAPSVEAAGVKLESHVHQAGALVAPNGPVTGATGTPS